MRRLVLCLGLALSACALSAPALAQSGGYPNRPVRIVVPFAPGGGVDTVGRIVAAKMSELLGQPVFIENRGGAGGNIGTAMVAKSPPDGYTILFTTSGHAIGPALYRNLPFDAAKDFVPVTQILATTFVLMAKPSLPANSLGELIALAKAKPGALNYGSAGLGSSLHLAVEMFKQSAGIDITHVPYRGDAPLRAALVAGEVDLGIASQSTALADVTSGSVRALAVIGTRRSPALPQVPTFAESGVSGLENQSWNGFFVPAGTPPEIVSAIQKATAAALAAPEVRNRLLGTGQDPVGNSSEEFAALVRADFARFVRVIERAGIQRLE
jgi:tripartite-type tricarboxylate transporter receptor subunit TctC